MKTHSGTLVSGGFTLGYSIEGRGPDALVIGSAVYYPRTFSQNLRQHLRMIFVDHRGFGMAPGAFTHADFELDVLVDDLENLRQALGLNKVIVIGHSGHAYMALHYAKKYPENVSHVVMLATSPDGSAASFQAADRYFDESVNPTRKALYACAMQHLADDINADPQHRFIHYSLRSGARIWYDPTYDARPLWKGVRVIPEMFDYVWGQLFRDIDITDGLERVTVPVFLGLGRYDFWNPPHLWEPLRDRFHDLRVRVFEQSGHTPQLEESALFDQELLAWLAQ